MCQPCHSCYEIFKDFIIWKMIPERIPKISPTIYSARMCDSTLFRISSNNRNVSIYFTLQFNYAFS